ncbi:gliding motility-associated C-terminal domain-containing protein [Fulvivirgaceae bacterium PWU5]|uniref:Gliding motility-associated C-terminal domain-containing protein n=1 Tax=Dawidia cretensis TaxID=2782350 RepID=A0AAP2DV01_9BACT|nr:gliding motility-associated C-terminal domain-containing protein [Dawidia cretensis]MBT1707896.1 gliding motility-associated C-terminal domain-containing protein [Dawidia cretensis]
MLDFCKRISVLISFAVLLLSGSRAYSQCIGLPAVAALGSNKVPAGLCAPVSANLIYTIQFASPVAAGQLELVYDWGDGSPSEVVTLTAGSRLYYEERTHDFPRESGCEYVVTMTIRYNGVPCSNTRQIQKISSWRTDEFNGGDIGLVSPVTNTPEHLVCEGSDLRVIFDDRSVFNCNSQFVQLPPNTIESPNVEDRWRQIIYNGPVSGNKIPNVSVNGTPLTSASGADIISNYADPRGTLHLVSPVRIDDARRSPSLEITAPGGFGAGFPKPGDAFSLTLRYWNFCNPYDDPDIPGPPADLVNGDHRPIQRTSIIRVIAPPAAPVPSSEVVCNGITPKAFSVTGVPSANTIRWYENIPGPDRPGALLGTGKTLPVTAHPAWVSNTTPGVYKVWASQQPTSGVVTCESPKTMVTRTIRERLEIGETAPAVPAEICNDSALSVVLPPAPVLPAGGATKYTWVGSDGVNLLPGSASTATFAVDVADFQGQLSVDRTIRVSESYSTTPACAVNKQYSFKVYRASVGGVVSLAEDVCEGSAVDTLLLTEAVGAIRRWEVRKDLTSFIPFTGISGDNYIVPGVLTPGTYTFRAVVGNGSCAELYSAESTVQVFALPTPVYAGSDQFHCSSLVSEPLDATVPSVGVGRWSYIASVPANLPAPQFSNVNAPNATISILRENAGAYTLRWTVTNDICQRYDDVVIDFGTTPSDALAGPDQALCGRETTLSGNTPQKGVGRWTLVSGPQNCQDNTSCSVVIENPLSPTSSIRLSNESGYGIYTVRWSISSGGNNCFLKTDDVTIRFDRPIGVAANDTDVICVDPEGLLPISLSGSVEGNVGTAYWANVNGHGNVSGSSASSGTITASYTPTLDDYTAGTPIRVKLVAVPLPASVCPSIEHAITIQIDRRPMANAGADIPFVCSADVALRADAPMYGAAGRWSANNAGVLFTDETDPYTGVTQLPAPPSRVQFTWTVTSASGRCVSKPSTVEVARVALPDVRDATVQQCEIFNGTTQINLSLSENSVTTLPAGQREISWYRGPGMIPVNSGTIQSGITDGEFFFARVEDTRTGCSAQAKLTVFVLPAPKVMDGLVTLCDETAGGVSVSGVDLTAAKFRDAVTDESDITIKWYSSLEEAQQNSNAIDTEIDVTRRRDIYARITKNVSPFCFSVAKVVVVVNPVPAVSAIFGRESVCQGHSATPEGELPFETYQVTPIPGATYHWEVPEGVSGFRIFGGGEENDFYLLLQFPNVLTGTIKVTPELNGCMGSAVEKPIRVDAAPVKPAIVGASEVYEDARGIPYAVSPNNYPSSIYNWEIRRRSDNSTGGAYIIEGQATGNILVNVLTEDVILSVRENNAMCASETASMVISVKELPPPEDLLASFNATPMASCFPATIVAQNLSTGADTYSWTLYGEGGVAATSNLINPQFTVSSPGTYRLQLIATHAATGESDQVQVSDIRVLDVPYAAFTVNNNVIYAPDTELKLLNFSSRADTYQWSFGDGETSSLFEPTHTYQQEGAYFLTLQAGIDHGQQDVDGDGSTDGPLICYDTAATQVAVREGGYIQIPNAFTPNESGPTGGQPSGEGINDVFRPIVKGVRTYKMQIFNRWGTKVFETEDPEVGWDGYNAAGELMHAGVYVYKIEMTLSNGEHDTRMGDVGLIH